MSAGNVSSKTGVPCRACGAECVDAGPGLGWQCVSDTCSTPPIGDLTSNPFAKRTSMVEVTTGGGKLPQLVLTFESVEDMQAASDFIRQPLPPTPSQAQIDMGEMLLEVESVLNDLGWHKDRGVLKRVTEVVDAYVRQPSTKNDPPATKRVSLANVLGIDFAKPGSDFTGWSCSTHGPIVEGGEHCPRCAHETNECRQCGPREMAEGKCDCIRHKYQR